MLQTHLNELISVCSHYVDGNQEARLRHQFPEVPLAKTGSSRSELAYPIREKKEGRKEMFYLSMYSTHFIYCYMASDIWKKEGNVLFNDTLNTFYLRLYGVGHMVKGHSDSERGNPLPPHGLLFPISSKGSFICTIPQTGYHIPQPLLHWLE